MNSAFKLFARTGEGHLRSKKIEHLLAFSIFDSIEKRIEFESIVGFVFKVCIRRKKNSLKRHDEKRRNDVVVSAAVLLSVALKYSNFWRFEIRIDRGNYVPTILSSN